MEPTARIASVEQTAMAGLGISGTEHRTRAKPHRHRENHRNTRPPLVRTSGRDETGSGDAARPRRSASRVRNVVYLKKRALRSRGARAIQAPVLLVKSAPCRETDVHECELSEVLRNQIVQVYNTPPTQSPCHRENHRKGVRRLSRTSGRTKIGCGTARSALSSLGNVGWLY